MAPRFIACLWPGSRPAPEAFESFRREAGRQGDWDWILQSPGLAILTRHDDPISVRDLHAGQGVVLGDLFRADGAPAAPELNLGRSLDPATLAKALMSRNWGRYVALFKCGADREPGLFRDPSGALDCVTWARDGMTYAASDVAPWCRPFLPAHLAIDWRTVAGMLVDPALIAGPIALDGVETVDPGELRLIHLGGAERHRLWSPARAATAATTSAQEARLRIPQVVQACVGALASARGPVLAELSGGLDSAIVGAALVRTPGSKVVDWVNYHVSDRQGDERDYAQLVANHLGVPLTLVAKADTVLDPHALTRASTGARPTLNRLDGHYDSDVTDRARTAGARAILTGQGGDSLFYQMPTALMLADRWRDRGLRGVTPLSVAEVALWTRQSAWRVLHTAGRAALGWDAGPLRHPADLLSDALRTASADDIPPAAWAQDLREIAPGKRRQIQGLAHTLNFFGDCARATEVDLIHPLLSQPILELLLSISAADLTEGGRDRALVRAAYAGQLPARLLARRSKGVLSAYYGRMLAASLTDLRPWLLEGPLVRQGLVNRKRLEARLDVDDLIWRGDYTDITLLAAVQAWVCQWEGLKRKST